MTDVQEFYPAVGFVAMTNHCS